MKNQKFGDIGDYGKYALLRFFAENGVSLAINSYLTENDGNAESKYISYLEKNEYFKYDSTLYVYLREFVINQNKKDVSLMEENELISGAKYYFEPIDNPGKYVKKEREEIRKQWHAAALEKCKGAELVYLDPDSGFRKSFPKKVEEQQKYCYADEVLDYYNSGSNVFYYVNRGRRGEQQWQILKRSMCQATPDAKMMGLKFQNELQCSYIFALHPEDEEKYRQILRDFLTTNWKEMFIEEHINEG